MHPVGKDDGGLLCADGRQNQPVPLLLTDVPTYDIVDARAVDDGELTADDDAELLLP